MCDPSNLLCNQIFTLMMFEHQSLIQTWCATKVDKDGIYHRTDWSQTGSWGFCGPDCPTDEKTKTWSKDETVKVTLTYSNPALRIGLELYGAILLWIFVLGLILTIFTPILGKSCPVHSFS